MGLFQPCATMRGDAIQLWAARSANFATRNANRPTKEQGLRASDEAQALGLVLALELGLKLELGLEPKLALELALWKGCCPSGLPHNGAEGAVLRNLALIQNNHPVHHLQQ